MKKRGPKTIFNGVVSDKQINITIPAVLYDDLKREVGAAGTITDYARVAIIQRLSREASLKPASAELVAQIVEPMKVNYQGAEDDTTT